MWIERLMAGISHQHVLSYNPKIKRIICRKCQPAGSLESIVYADLFLWKKLAEDQTDKWTAVKKLPEESYWEV